MIAASCAPRFNLRSELHPGYRLHRLRGRGGFGEVWEAESEGGGLVALKFLRCSAGQMAAHELRSIQVVQCLPHAHLTRIDRVWCAAEFLVVAMELADGSLADLLEVYQAERGAALPASHLLPLLSQAAEALDYLNHRQHLVGAQWLSVQHCDVTPANMLLFGKTLKLSDFGLTTTLAGRAKTHTRAGTPAFAPPETFEGWVSERTDQYGLAMCYCLLRGARLPFADLPPDFQTAPARAMPQLDMLAPAERPVIARALAPLPKDRWNSCKELFVELDRCTSPPAAAASSRPDARRHSRYGAGGRTRCEVRPTLGNERWQAKIQNLSVGGARLRIIQPGCDFKPGRILVLELTAATGVRRVVQLRLAHSSAQPGGDYEVGGAFDPSLTAADVAAFSDTLP